MSERSEQSYARHTRWVPGYHFVLSTLLVLALVGSLVNLWRAVVLHESGRLEAAVLVALIVACMQLFWYCRVFPLKAQDRAIRVEENLRHHLLTGSLLDSRLRTRQVIALRFASDAELPLLARRAAEEGLAPDAIKQAILTWRPDTYRV